MFHAFVIVCAASFNMEIDEANCISFEDTWGPYITEENCTIRANQIVDELVRGEMNPIISTILKYPQMIYAEGHCRKLEGQQV